MVGVRILTIPRTVIRSVNIPTMSPRKVVITVAGATAEGVVVIRGGVGVVVIRGGVRGGVGERVVGEAGARVGEEGDIHLQAKAKVVVMLQNQQ